MKYAVRMVIIPESEYQSLKAKHNLGKKKPKTHKAFIKLTQDLGRKIRQRDQEKTQQQRQVQASIAKVDLHRTAADLVQHLPPVYQPKTRLALKELLDQGFSWKDNKELTVPSGQTLSGSNIVDLLKEAFVPRKKGAPKPTGWLEFIQSVASSGVPQSLFTKKETKRALQESQRIEGPGADWLPWSQAAFT